MTLGRPKGRAKKSEHFPARDRVTSEEVDAQYEALRVELVTKSRLEEPLGTALLARSVVDYRRHLDELALRSADGSITSDERRIVPAMLSGISRALAVLGLTDLKKKVIEDL